jgi:antitoxin (DNA-binding transcriptional repressor) of toxin-antitoxin stability system
MGVSGLIKAAEAGNTKIVTRGSKPVAAVISITQLEALEDFLEDFVDVAVVRARFATTSARTFSLDEVLQRFGSNREELRKHPAY